MKIEDVIQRMADLSVQRETSLSALSKSIGRDAGYLTDAMQGRKKDIGALDLAKIARTLQTSVAYLMGEPVSVTQDQTQPNLPDAEPRDVVGHKVSPANDRLALILDCAGEGKARFLLDADRAAGLCLSLQNAHRKLEEPQQSLSYPLNS